MPPALQAERVILERINTALEANQPARSLPLKPNELALIKALDLLTMKPMIYAANVAEGDLADQGASNPHVVAMRQRAAEEGASLVIVSAQVLCPALPVGVWEHLQGWRSTSVPGCK